MLPKFPRQSLQVLRIIRDEVPRPERLPTGDCELRWGRYCPMGLHDDSLKPSPAFPENFAGGRCKEGPVWRFAYWWDKIKTCYAQEGVDFIWGKDVVT